MQKALCNILTKPDVTKKLDLLENSKPYDEYCQIKASNDVEATIAWLNRYQDNINSYRAYKRESERFLFWCCYESGISFNNLKIQDLEQYFSFLSDPPKHLLKNSPFTAPLNAPAKAFTKRALNSLLNFLVNTNYLRSNPLKLLKKSKFIDFTDQKYKVWERMLEEDEWQAVQQALQAMPARNHQEIDNKMRTQFLFALLYFLGLRINEVATHTWNSFRKRNEQWWFFVKGKGGKLGHIPVNEQLLTYVKNYRLHLAKQMLPKTNETEPLFISMHTKRPLKVKQLYTLFKNIGLQAAESFQDKTKQQKLRKLSPHWLRHLSASHQDKAGILSSIIQANHRHSSIQTTQNYVHAEEARRFTEVQKMRMDLDSRLLIPQSKENAIEITMKLTKGPINKLMGLHKVISGLENQVLTKLSWKRLTPSNKELFNITENTLFNGIELIYQLYSKEVLELKEVWIRAFIRQAEIWLFNAKISTREIEAAHGSN